MLKRKLIENYDLGLSPFYVAFQFSSKQLTMLNQKQKFSTVVL